MTLKAWSRLVPALALSLTATSARAQFDQVTFSVNEFDAYYRSITPHYNRVTNCIEKGLQQCAKGDAVHGVTVTADTKGKLSLKSTREYRSVNHCLETLFAKLHPLPSGSVRLNWDCRSGSPALPLKRYRAELRYILGPLTYSEAQETVVAKASDLDLCADQPGKVTDGSTFTVQIEVQAGGTPGSVTADRAPGDLACIKKVFAGLRFPKQTAASRVAFHFVSL